MAGLPLLLRREPFGGVLFIPNGAVHIELDAEAYALVRDHLQGHRPLQSDEERALVGRIETELRDLRTRRVELFEPAPQPHRWPFTVLAAPTLVDFAITERCTMGCPHCYASSVARGRDVPLEEVELVLEQLAGCGVMQIALGGGEPLGHPDIKRILERCQAHHLVPSLTTNGLHLRPDILDALERYCGAVALSLEAVGARYAARRRAGFDHFERCLELLLGRGLPTVLQVTSSAESFAELDDIVAFCLEHPSLYGVIFLAYKEVGRGSGYHHALSALEPRLVHERLRAAMLALCPHMRVGYDCCLTPAMVGMQADLGLSQDDQLEGCSALRSSLGVMTNLDVTPCTFLPALPVGNLRQRSLASIWTGRAAERFRRTITRQMVAHRACCSCASQADCLGGCPAFDLVHCTAGAGGSRGEATPASPRLG